MGVVALTTTPTYPVPGREARVTATAGNGGNFVRLWVTDAPVGSELRKRLTDTGATRIQIHEGDSGDAFSFTPDVGGVYVIAAREYSKGAATFGGSFEGDTQAYASETATDVERSLSLYVGQRLTQSLGFGADAAQLVCYVWGSTIRRTRVDAHGEASPAIVRWTSERARTAALSATMATKLAALVDVAVSTAVGTPATILNEMVADINAHMAMGATTHNSADADNTLDRTLDGASAPEGIQYVANQVATALARHMLNDDDGAGPGTAASAYHQISTPKGDWASLAALRNCGDTASAFAVIGAIWDAYEAHRVNTAVHGTADATNTLTALPALLAVHQTFASVVRAASPTAPASENAGATYLIHVAGFKAAPEPEPGLSVATGG